MYTVLLIEIYLPVKFQIDTSLVSGVCSGQNIGKFSEATGPTEAKCHVTPAWDKGKDGKLICTLIYLGYLLLSIIVNPAGTGGHLAGNLPEIWPRSAWLLAGLGKLRVKSPAIPRPLGGGDTNDSLVYNNMREFAFETLF